MTEEEAKIKWCPFARAQQFQPVHNVLAASGEPLSDNPAVNRESWDVSCIGSGCMAWRGEFYAPQTFESCEMGRHPVGDGWKCTLPEDGREKYSIKSKWEREVPRSGYCGLAGKP